MKKEEIINYIKKKNIVFLKSRKKKEALKELWEVISKTPKITDPNKFLKAILKREKIMSTGIGAGIGVPHVKHETVKDFVIGIGISKEGIKYSALDGKPVNILIMIGAPAHKHEEYLKLLARIVLVLKDEKFRNKIINAKTTTEVYRLLLQKLKKE